MSKTKRKALTGCLSFAMAAMLTFGSSADISVHASEKTAYINQNATGLLNTESPSEADEESLFPALMKENIKVTGDTIAKASDDEEPAEDICETAETEETAAEETAAETEEAAAETEKTEETAAETEETAAVDIRSAVTAFALQFIGCPYVYGGTSLSGGCDCSGFTMGVFGSFGVSLPHSSASQSGCGRVISIDSVQPGDLIFYGDDDGIHHVALYIGDGQIVHAIDESKGIGVSSMYFRTPVCAVSVLD